MYDALLDELEDEPTPNQEEVSELPDKPAGELDLDDDLDVVELGTDLDIELDPKAEELLEIGRAHV